MNTPEQNNPASVTEGSQQAGEALSQKWSWVEATVWTERMLQALETGPKGNKWFRLWDKVVSERNLHRAFARVRSNDGSAGVDGKSVAAFARQERVEVEKLSGQLRSGKYRPQAVRRVYIEKAGSKEKRPLGIPTVDDRVVQGALRNVIEPIFEREFAEHSYGFRPGRRCHDALGRVEELLKGGYTFVVDADLKGYFDSIPHAKLLEKVGQRIADGRVLGLIESYLKAGVLERMKDWEPTEQGTPQGAVVSPLLANLYLNELDWTMSRGGYEMVRYADDFVILCRSRAEAEQALATVQAWVAEAGLTLHPEKTRLVDVQEEKASFEFLGYHFERGYQWPRQKSLEKIKEKIRSWTKRNNGRSLEENIRRLNEILRGWFNYFRKSVGNVFSRLDGMIRRRLRTMLHKRNKKRGMARNLAAHCRWTNAYFEAHGLYSLVTAHARALQPP
jgi:RNA-directed DNA polymerase